MGASNGHCSEAIAVSESAPYPLYSALYRCQLFCRAVRILSERLHSLHSFPTFYLQYILFPRIQRGEATSWKKERQRVSLNERCRLIYKIIIWLIFINVHW